MNIQNVLGVAVLVLVVAVVFQATNESPVSASAAPAIQVDDAAGFEYARLVVFDDFKNVQWLIGGRNNFFPKESVANTFSRLGGRGPNGFSDLLNQIGSQNWRLVQKDDNVWIFSRKAS